KTAKETTYSATNKDVIYRVKAFIEMFVYRFSRGVAGFLLLAAGWLGWGAAGAAYVGVPLALLWIFSAWRLAASTRSSTRPCRPTRDKKIRGGPRGSAPDPFGATSLRGRWSRSARRAPSWSPSRRAPSESRSPRCP